MAKKNKLDPSKDADFKRKRGFKVMGLNLNADGVVKGFFGGNAYLAILFLLFICIFLFRSAIGFIPGYRTELAEARISGIEAANHINYQLTGYDAIYTKINQAFINERRARFGALETVVPIYEELESIIDDQLEDEVDEYTELDDGPEKDAAAIALRKSIREQSATLSREELLEKIQTRLPETETISEESYKKALMLAEQYALNDYETPDEVSRIPSLINEQMGSFHKAIDAIKHSDDALRDNYSAIEKHALKTYQIISNNRKNQESIDALSDDLENPDLSSARTSAIQKRISELKPKITEISTDENIKLIYAEIKKHDQVADAMISEFQLGVDLLAEAEIKTEKSTILIKESSRLFDELKQITTERKALLKEWSHKKPVTLWDSITAFFFGADWKTGSNRQSLYGLMPLFTGSLLISVVAMLFAVPLAIGAAIYVNQFASKREAGLLKPAIEFIQAIPSVVLGLFGVLVVAGLLQGLSQVEWLQWIPGFPIQDRLNVLLAGILLAFMACPTIFTLAEDALNNVPKAYTEASLAMGANKLQTALKIVVPASLSGIVAAVMLGFGRVIGETMVVLLVAGNKARIPDLSEGLGVMGESVHTMTGIIAQEYGEVEPGVLHWKALFMVGLVLFLISLCINSVCQRVISRRSNKT